MKNIPELGESPSMDNTDRSELAWFAGIVEGEGSICLTRPKEGYRMPTICRLEITNTDELLMNKCQQIIASIIGKIPTIRIKRFKKPLGKKIVLNIDIGAQFDVLMILTMIVPYLVGIKKRKALLVIEFLHKRKEFCNKERVEERSLEFRNIWKDYAEKFARVETKRNAPEMGDAIVRPGKQLSEIGRNDQFLLSEN